MPACHLVAHRELPLDGQIDLDHLEDARRQLIALLESGNFFIENRLDDHRLVFDVREDAVDPILGRALGNLDFPPTSIGDRREHLLGDRVACPEPFHAPALVAD